MVFGHGNDDVHATVDGDGVGPSLIHDVSEDFGEDEGVVHEGPLGVEGDAGLPEKLGGGFLAPSNERGILAGALDALAEFGVGVIHHVELPEAAGNLRGRHLPCAVAPTAGAADAHDLFAQRVLQAIAGPQPPEQFVLIVHHHILHAHPGLHIFVLELAEEAGVSAFIPVIHRAGIMADEHEIEAILVDQRVEEPAAGGIDQNRVKVAFGNGASLILVPGYRQRKEFEREVGGGLELGQFGDDVIAFLDGVGFSMNAAPRPPTGGLFARRDFVGQDRLDFQRQA